MKNLFAVLTLVGAWGTTLLPVFALTVAWNPNPEPDIAAYRVTYSNDHFPDVTKMVETSQTTASVSGLLEGATYQIIVQAINQSGLMSEPSVPITYVVPVTVTENVTPISHLKWSIQRVSSEELFSEWAPASAAIDGDTKTFWHSQYTPTTKGAPHEMEIDLGQVHSVHGFRVTPRQDGWANGNIALYEFQTSLDGVTWVTNATGKISGWPLPQEVRFEGADARKVRLRALSEAQGQPFAAVAELDVLEVVRMVRVTLQRGSNLTGWTDVQSLELTKQDHEFFRLKIETP